MANQKTAQVPSTSEAQAEIEMLRRRIDQLQQSQSINQDSQQLQQPSDVSTDPYPNSNSLSVPRTELSSSLGLPNPPAYTPYGGDEKTRQTETSSYSNGTDLASVPSVLRAPMRDSRMQSLSLTKPVAIPATNAKLGSPFLRAYAPFLLNLDLPPEAFLRFLDDLNRVAVASPPLQVLGLAGMATSFVPLATAQIVGNAVSFAAQAGTVAVSKGRTEVFLRAANQDIFGPRGLKVEIAKLDAIAKIAGIPILDSSGKKIEKSSRLLSDLEGPEVSTLSGQERRLHALGAWIEALEVTPLPSIEQQSNPLSRLNQAASERQRTKGEEKLIKDREKGLKKIRKDGGKAEREYEKELRKLEKEEGKARRKEDGRKLEKELEKIDKDRRKAAKEYEKETRQLMKDDKEEKVFRKILWIVIRKLEDGGEHGPDPYMYESP